MSPSPSPHHSSRVAVLVDTATTWGRGIITGIQKFNRTHLPGWRLYLEARGVEEPISLPPEFHPDGFIARVGNTRLAHDLERSKVPVVNVSTIQLPGVTFPRITNDVAAVARLAAEYFIGRRFKHFAYLNFRGLEYVARQRDAFAKAVSAAGYQCAMYDVKPDLNAQGPEWGLNVGKLADWLLALPKPVAILTWNGGREVIHACHDAGLRMPEEVALLNGSEDRLTNELSPIPLSGVQAACEKIGYEAAALLHHLMKGGRAPVRPRLIAPLRVISRQSTDTMAITDRPLIEALRFIREHLTTPILVDKIAAHVGVSRRILERRFVEILGHSPAAYITSLRLDHAKKLLVETDLSIADVATSSGFNSPEYMTYLFHREVGTTPLRYRRNTKAK